MCDQQSFRSACAYAQSDQSLCLSLDYSVTVKLLTENHLEFLSLKGGCTGLSEPTLVKMPHCWKSHVTAQLCVLIIKVSVTDGRRLILQYIGIVSFYTAAILKFIQNGW